MANALDIAKKAVALWRSVHGTESLYLQCQRFSGYYEQWAYQGNETGIRTYMTATAAGNASRMYETKNINSASVKPGDQVFWHWQHEGHVATVLGRQNGRTVVSHTGAGGSDRIQQLGNGVLVSHADTINLPFRGISRTNGANRQRTGMTAWPNVKKPATTTSSEDNEMIFIRKNKQAKVYAYNPVSGKKRAVGTTEWSAIKKAFGAGKVPLPIADLSAAEAKHFGL